MAHILSLLNKHESSSDSPFSRGIRSDRFNAVIAAGTPLVAKGLQSIVSTIPEIGGAYLLSPDYLRGPKALGVVDEVRRKSIRTLWILECRLYADWDPCELMKKVLLSAESQDSGSRKDLVMALVDCDIDSLPVMVTRIAPQAICCLREPEKVVVSAIQSALEGAVYRSPKLQDFANVPTALLSQKEMATVVAIVQGLSIGEIAYNWNVSRKTVSTFRGRALKKLGLQSDVDLVRYMALRHPGRFSANGEEISPNQGNGLSS